MKSFLLTVLFLLVVVPVALCAEFWGSKHSNKYHFPTCRSAKHIYPQNLVKFSSPSEAQKAGYIPCKICKPPTK